jgi:hypothetical protein
MPRVRSPFGELERGDAAAENDRRPAAARLFQDALCILHVIELEHPFQICARHLQRHSLRADCDQQFIVRQIRIVIELKGMSIAREC